MTITKETLKKFQTSGKVKANVIIQKPKGNAVVKAYMRKPANNNAYIYCRVNADKQTSNSNNSLRMQRESCEEYCLKNGLNIVKSFEDNSVGVDLKRKEFVEMTNSLITGKANVKYIVVYSFDRFSRGRDMELYYELKERGIKLLSVTQPVVEGKYSKALKKLVSAYNKYLKTSV